MLSWFGLPVSMSEDGGQLVYEFQLRGANVKFADDTGPVARVAATFDKRDQRPTVIETSVTRYRSNLDVKPAEVQVGIKF